MSHHNMREGHQNTQQHKTLAHCKKKCAFVDQLRKLMHLRAYQYSTADRIVRFNEKRGTSDKLARRIKVD